MKRICLKCSCTKIWSLKDGRFRCAKCRQTFSDPRKYVHIKTTLLRDVVEEFLLEHSTNIILNRVAISKYMLLKVLTLLRVAMTHDLPEVFEGTVEVDETYLVANGKINAWLSNTALKKPNAAEAPPNKLFLAYCAAMAKSGPI